MESEKAVLQSKSDVQSKVDEKVKVDDEKPTIEFDDAPETDL